MPCDGKTIGGKDAIINKLKENKINNLIIP
jgi:hypothetical protein